VRLAILLAISIPTTVFAEHGISIYKVKQNDTVGLIASEYYGDRNKAAFIMAENKIQHPRPLRPGERLRVPITREITTQPGDTFQTLATTLLGDVRHGGFLAEANNMPPDASLPAGTVIVVPFTVAHKAEATEPLTAIAASYYGEPKYADVLKRYNDLDRPALEKGETLLVPSYNMRVHPTKLAPPDAESKQRREDRDKFRKAAAIAIPIARHAWRIGDYATIRTALEKIDTAYVDLDPAIECGVLFGSALVAFRKDDDAREVFKRIIDRKPTHTLRKVDHSPKVLAVWSKAGGQIE
jgi:LysM repeat protein